MISLKDVWPASHVKVTELETGKVTARSRPKLQVLKLKIVTADDLNKGMIAVSDDLKNKNVKLYSDSAAPKYKLAGIDFSDMLQMLDNLIVSAKPLPAADQYQATAT